MFSIGLGLTQVLAPGTIADLIGISDDDPNRNMLRSPLYGMRELAAGAGILTQSNPARWLWGRVAGDLMDLGSLAAACKSDHNDKGQTYLRYGVGIERHPSMFFARRS